MDVLKELIQVLFVQKHGTRIGISLLDGDNATHTLVDLVSKNAFNETLLLETLGGLNQYMRSGIYTDYTPLFQQVLPNVQTIARTEELPNFVILVSDAKIAPDSYRLSNPIRQRYSIRQIIKGKRVIKELKAEYITRTSSKSEISATLLCFHS